MGPCYLTTTITTVFCSDEIDAHYMQKAEYEQNSSHPSTKDQAQLYLQMVPRISQGA